MSRRRRVGGGRIGPRVGSRARAFVLAAVAGVAVAVGTVLGGCAPTPDESAADAPPSSILLIVVDTLRADHLGLYGYERETSPNLDRWAERAVVFERAVAPSSWTLPTMGSLLTGLYPAQHGAGLKVESGRDGSAVGGADSAEVRRFGRFTRLSAEVATLPERLSEAGYFTRATVTNAFLTEEFGLGRGFIEYDDADPAEPRRSADAIVDQALGWLESVDEPYFFLLHLFDPHLPYHAPQPFAGRWTSAFEGSELSLPVRNVRALRRRAAELSEVDRGFVTAAYDEEVRFVDEEIGRLFDALERDGRLDSTIVLLTSDHGEELFEHGGFEHGHSLYQEVLHVPLIVWHPDFEPRRVRETVSIVDLAPTLLELAGVPNPGDLRGRSLLPLFPSGSSTGPPPPVGAQWNLYGGQETAIFDGARKLVLDDARRPVRLHDLDTDPGERTNLAEREAEQVEALSETARELLAEAPRPQDEAVLDEATRRELESLGYLD